MNVFTKISTLIQTSFWVHEFETLAGANFVEQIFAHLNQFARSVLFQWHLCVLGPA